MYANLIKLFHSINFSNSGDQPDADKKRTRLPHHKRLPFIQHASSNEGYFQPNIFLQHVDEMTRVLSELSHGAQHDVVERVGPDEVWMLPSNPAGEKKLVTTDIEPTVGEKKLVTIDVEPTVVIFNKKEENAKAKEAAQQLDSGGVQEELEPADMSIGLKLIFVLLANGCVALALVLFWAIVAM